MGKSSEIQKKPQSWVAVQTLSRFFSDFQSAKKHPSPPRLGNNKSATNGAQFDGFGFRLERGGQNALRKKKRPRRVAEQNEAGERDQ